MRKTVSRKWLKEIGACTEAVEWIMAQKERRSIPLLRKLMETEKQTWANWGITRLMTHTQQVQYAVYAAEQVLDIFEGRYPADDRPRKAIEAARDYLQKPSAASAAAYDAAYDAADAAAHAADDAAHAAAYAASAAADAAHATDAAAYADDAYAAAKRNKLTKILEYGISLLECGK